MDAGFISAAGMRAQGDRIRVLSENVANVESMGVTPGADPYRRKVITFKEQLDNETGVRVVKATKIAKDMSDFELKFLPGHPGADANGYVKVPNVNIAFEMADMREAQRSYEANLGMLELSRNIMNKLVDLLRA
jgi:flagellar basal-body rod protein FlgC